MHEVQKKRRHSSPGRWALALAAALLLFAALAAYLATRPQPQQRPTLPDSTVTLSDYASEEVSAITVTRAGEAPWTVRRGEDGLLTLTDADGFTLTEALSAELLEAARCVVCEDVLTEDPATYADRLNDFGLDAPWLVTSITYTDGRTLTLRMGNALSQEGTSYYLLADGDDRLFEVSKGVAEALYVSRASLWPVEQPLLHRARLDRITLTTPAGVLAEWALAGDIADADAADKWYLTQPFRYPADAQSLDNLRRNAENLRLGTYVGPATAENLTAYGFDAPRLVIALHMAAGDIMTSDSTGAYYALPWPESECVLTVGGAQSDLVDYVRYGDGIYACSHFSYNVFLSIEPRNTLSRYPLGTALGNLAALTVEQGDRRDEYVLTRVERVGENNSLVTDESGNPVMDVTVTRNGVPLDYAMFEAAYNDLALVTVSGALPEGAAPAASPHTVYTFRDVDGSTVHTVALSDFDTLHDAVTVDGATCFYLIKDGFVLNLPAT